MRHLFNPKVMKGLLSILVLLLAVKTLWFIVEVLWLPSNGITQPISQNTKSLYYRVKLTPNEIRPPSKIKKNIVKQSGSIKDITLLAIYNSSDISVVTVRYKGKSKVLGRGDEVNGYALENAGNNFAMFIKNSKTYKVMLEKSKNLNNVISPTIDIKPKQNITKKAKSIAGNIVDAGDHKVIDRTLLDHYANNMEDIYKNIGISEVKNDNGIEGFRITFVRKGSPFEKLGLRREDVIKSINGQEINSYNAAFGVYKNIKNVENLTLVIKRGTEDMELEYEID